MPTLVRYLIPFVETEPGSTVLWDQAMDLPLPAGELEPRGFSLLEARDVALKGDYTEELGFFYPPVAEVFSLENRTPRTWTALKPKSNGLFNSVQVLLFPGRIGLLLLEQELASPDLRMIDETCCHWSQAGGSEDRHCPAIRTFMPADLEGKLTPFTYGRRSLTFVASELPGGSGEDLRRACLELTTHRPENSEDGLRSEAVERLFNEHGFEEWKRWASLVYRDNMAIAHLPVSPKVRNMLVGDLFRLYLFAIYLKLRLIQMMGAVTGLEQDGQPSGSRRDVDGLLDFRNKFWFAEVTRHTTGRALYTRLVSALGLKTLLHDVQEEVHVIQARREAHLQKLVALATVLFLPLAGVTGFFGMNIGESWTTVGGWLWFAAGLLVLATVVAAPLASAVGWDGSLRFRSRRAGEERRQPGPTISVVSETRCSKNDCDHVDPQTCP